ncbi:hypothetical protein CDAR_574151 [Caerostris darwini]|uniref:Uncharacterized protein n=1 Tax=Caerostris darwini TaxID=1538125 RepID=A0AAV4T921_9ARAC|nr:hypothetical protein CDAR_574151 [Caerostris darwini]
MYRSLDGLLVLKHTWELPPSSGVKLNIQVDSLEFALIPSMSSSSFRMINVVRGMLLNWDVITPYRSWSGAKLSSEYSAVSTPNEVKSSAMGKMHRISGHSQSLTPNTGKADKKKRKEKKSLNFHPRLFTKKEFEAPSEDFDNRDIQKRGLYLIHSGVSRRFEVPKLLSESPSPENWRLILTLKNWTLRHPLWSLLQIDFNVRRECLTV